MEFPEQLKKEMMETYSKWHEAETRPPEERARKFGSTTMVTVRYIDGLRRELRSGPVTWYSDFSKRSGGKGEYPGPLQQFLAGLPLCQMSHYAERASAWGFRIESLEMAVRGHFVAMPGHGFDAIEYDTRIVSPEDEEKIKKLVSAAENDCYVTNTLKRTCKLTGHIYLNGESLIETHPS